ncbi:MAG: hypothetical protein V7638_3857 [Acidobacteriota bacterium]|jgi:hypothetical protein
MTSIRSVANLNIHDRVTFTALNEAHERGAVSSVRDAWVSDETIQTALKIDGTKLLCEEFYPRADSHSLVLQQGRAIVSLIRENREFTCTVYNSSMQSATDVLDVFRKALPWSERKSGLLDVTYWHYTEHGVRTLDRQLQVPTWEQIAANYPAATRDQLVRLHGMRPTEDSGKLMLWRGEPGTGKTYALRALGDVWGPWCRLHIVIDADNFFDHGDYLLRVILGDDGGPTTGEQKKRYRLVVLEDSGELLAKDARLQTGGRLSRFLNLTSGLLGQGLRVLVLITTNEDVGALHEAVSRPGRCFSQIEFSKFGRDEAYKWLDEHDARSQALLYPNSNTKQSTLAELFAMKDGGDVPQVHRPGFVATTLHG